MISADTHFYLDVNNLLMTFWAKVSFMASSLKVQIDACVDLIFLAKFLTFLSSLTLIVHTTFCWQGIFVIFFKSKFDMLCAIENYTLLLYPHQHKKSSEYQINNTKNVNICFKILSRRKQMQQRYIHREIDRNCNKL